MSQAEHPVSCPKCLARWDFRTDQLGRLVAQHPVSPCVAPPAPQYELEDEEYDLLPERKCEECGKYFNPKATAKGTQVICGAECRKVRRARQKLESDDRRGSFWLRRPKAA